MKQKQDLTKSTEAEDYLLKPKEKKQQRIDTKTKATVRRIDTKSLKENRWN
jgi:hypothetical protein